MLRLLVAAVGMAALGAKTYWRWLRTPAIVTIAVDIVLTLGAGASPLIVLLLTVVLVMLLTVFTVTTYRVTYFGVGGVSASLYWTLRETRMLGWAMVIGFGFFGGIGASAALWYELVPGSSPLTAMILVVPAFAGLIYLSGRVCLLFPGIAIVGRSPLGSAWNQSRSNGWRLGLIAAVPPTIVVLLSWLLSYLAFIAPWSLVHVAASIATSVSELAVGGVTAIAVCLAYVELERSRHPESGR